MVTAKCFTFYFEKLTFHVENYYFLGGRFNSILFLIQFLLLITILKQQQKKIIKLTKKKNNN